MRIMSRNRNNIVSHIRNPLITIYRISAIMINTLKIYKIIDNHGRYKSLS